MWLWAARVLAFCFCEVLGRVCRDVCCTFFVLFLCPLQSRVRCSLYRARRVRDNVVCGTSPKPPPASLCVPNVSKLLAFVSAVTLGRFCVRREAANEAVEAALSSADADREEACAELAASMEAEVSGVSLVLQLFFYATARLQ